jgi:hypothetical protein
VSEAEPGAGEAGAVGASPTGDAGGGLAGDSVIGGSGADSTTGAGTTGGASGLPVTGVGQQVVRRSQAVVLRRLLLPERRKGSVPGTGATPTATVCFRFRPRMTRHSQKSGDDENYHNRDYNPNNPACGIFLRKFSMALFWYVSSNRYCYPWLPPFLDPGSIVIVTRKILVQPFTEKLIDLTQFILTPLRERIAEIVSRAVAKLSCWCLRSPKLTVPTTSP